MLTLATDPLPQTRTVYVAFRVAFLETCERIVLARQIGEEGNLTSGYLTEVSYLHGTAPAVQLELLADTWRKHVSRERFPATLCERAVVYAAAARTARIADTDPESFRTYIVNGPQPKPRASADTLSRALQALAEPVVGHAEFLRLGRIEDLPPERSSEWKMKHGIDLQSFDEFLAVLGRWRPREEFAAHLSGLLRPDEISRMMGLWQFPTAPAKES